MNNSTNIFEIATKNKYRFPYKGMCTVEDLWDLSISALDGVFKTLNQKLRAEREESLLRTKSKEDERLDIQIEIVKHIVQVKQNEIKEKALERANKEKKEKLLAILEDKEDEAYRNMSADDIRKLIDAM